jgi:hypothetical protein
MLPVEGDEECVKIIKVENGTLDHLTEVLLEVTLGFNVPAELNSSGWRAGVHRGLGAANSILLVTFRVGAHVLHGVAILLGGLHNASSIGTLAKIDYWFRYIMWDIQDIPATRNALGELFTLTHTQITSMSMF